MNEIQKYIERIAGREHLSVPDAGRVFQIIMAGGATPAQIAAVLTGLRINGETYEEIAGAALAIRNKMKKLDVSWDVYDKTIDVCGTGGDNKGSYNISTAVSFVVAGGGLHVAKHGNKAVSSKSGSADVLRALGVNIEMSADTASVCLARVGMCFMLAPVFHPAMRNVAPTRQELGIRTIFNLVGPLVNPAAPKYQLVGVYSRSLLEPMARVLQEVGVKRAWVVHGADGMDEITITGESYAVELKDEVITHFVIKPQELGIEIPENPDDLIGGNEIKNAQAVKLLLKGESGAYRDIVLINSAAALVIGGRAVNLREGLKLAADSIDSGRAAKVLEKLVEISNSEILGQ